MSPQTTLDQAQQGLTYLLGQNTVPSAESSRRAFYISSGIERIYRAFDFDAAYKTVTATPDDNGEVDLTTLGISIGVMPNIQHVTDGVHEYMFSMVAHSQNWHAGDYRYWIESNDNGHWTLHVTDGGSLTLVIQDAPEISNSQAVAFTQMVIAKAAIIYYRQAQDPDADVSVEEDEFRQELSEVMETQNRRRPQQFASSPRDHTGQAIGYTRGGRPRR